MVSGVLRVVPVSVIVTPWMPKSGLLNVPELLWSMITRPEMPAPAGTCWNMPKSMDRLLWLSGVLASLFGLSPVGMPGPRAMVRLWTDPPDPSGPVVLPWSWLSVAVDGAGSNALLRPVLDRNEESTPPALKLLAATSTA